MEKLASRIRGLTDEKVVIAGQADRNDVFPEVYPLLKLDQREVVLVGEEVVLRVDDLVDHFELDGGLRLAGRSEVPLSDSNPDLRDDEAKTSDHKAVRMSTRD